MARGNRTMAREVRPTYRHGANDAQSNGHILVGTSGWAYRSWRAHLYGDVPARAWLAHASSTFGSLEINGSFYTQIAPETYRRWCRETPRGFRFALKGHRFVTHYKRLRNVDRSIALLRDAAKTLGDKLAVVVWQLPANFPADPDRLRGFLSSLGIWPGVRHAIDLRHQSWFTREVADLLRQAHVASCLSDAPDFPLWTAITADFVYVRLHGHTRKYASSAVRTFAAGRTTCAAGRARDATSTSTSTTTPRAPRSATPSPSVRTSARAVAETIRGRTRVLVLGPPFTASPEPRDPSRKSCCSAARSRDCGRRTRSRADDRPARKALGLPGPALGRISAASGAPLRWAPLRRTRHRSSR